MLENQTEIETSIEISESDFNQMVNDKDIKQEDFKADDRGNWSVIKDGKKIAEVLLENGFPQFFIMLEPSTKVSE